MSDTPRTDAALIHGHKSVWTCKGNTIVNSDFARQLERELNEARRELEETRKALADTYRCCDNATDILSIAQDFTDTAQSICNQFCAVEAKHGAVIQKAIDAGRGM